MFIPLGHSPDVDPIATRAAEIIRVEVKTTARARRDHSRWDVMICTRGGNQSWSGVSKLFDRDRREYLFVLVGDGRPTAVIEGTSGLALGGPKYAEFEVERGRPILRAAGA